MKKFIFVISLAWTLFSSTACDEKKPSPQAADLARCAENSSLKSGESFPSADGCNTCHCSEGGRVSCTKKACQENSTAGVACSDAISKYTNYISKFHRQDNRGCLVDSDCELKNLAYGPCSLPSAYKKSMFTTKENAHLNSLSGNIGDLCSRENFGPNASDVKIKCPDVDPYNVAVCRQNLCEGAYKYLDSEG